MRQAMNLFRTACLSNCYNNIMIMHKAMVRMVNTGNWLSERKGERERGKGRERGEGGVIVKVKVEMFFF